VLHVCSERGVSLVVLAARVTRQHVQLVQGCAVLFLMSACRGDLLSTGTDRSSAGGFFSFCQRGVWAPNACVIFLICRGPGWKSRRNREA
jgi:hypothetical protein